MGGHLFGSREIAMRKRFAVASLLILGVGCERHPTPPSAASATSAAATPSSQSLTIGNDPFAAPQALCDVLDASGLRTRGWKSNGIDWSCSSPYREIGAASTTSLATNLAYYVVGDSPARAHTAKLVLNVNDRTTKSEGLPRLVAAAQTLVEAVGLAMPSRISEALVSGSPRHATVSGVTYAVQREQTSIETLTFALIDSAAAVAKERARKTAIETTAEIFAACKQAISSDLSYPVSSLSGDGEPIQESGYQSFMVKGKNRDLFFCEVYPDRKYKISAAFAAQYPFKDVASGSL